MGRVTDEAVERVLETLNINRGQRRAIQQMSIMELKKYLVTIYRRGFEDGADAMDQAVRMEAAAKHSEPEGEYDEVKADWDDVLRLISEVKGIGKKLTEAIDQKMREAMG